MLRRNGMPTAITSSETQVNTYTTGDQAEPSVATFSSDHPTLSGGKIIVWQSAGQDGSGWGVYGQLYDASGQVIGGEFQIDVSAQGDQLNPSVLILEDGNILIGWYGEASNGTAQLYTQKFEWDGTDVISIGSQLTIDTSVNPQWQNGTNGPRFDIDHAPSLVALSNGGYAISWIDIETVVRVAFYDEVNSLISSDALTLSKFATNLPSITALANGNILLTYHDYTGSASLRDEAYGRIYNSDGLLVTGTFKLNSSTAHWQADVATSALADGGFVAVWKGWTATNGDLGIKMRFFSDDGTETTQEFNVSTVGGVINSAAGFDGSVILDDASTLDVVTLGDGSILVVWGANGGGNSNIYAQRFTTSGQASGDVFIVNTHNVGDQLFAEAELNADGTVTVTWQSSDADGRGTGVQARTLSIASDGSLNDGPVAMDGELSATEDGSVVVGTVSATDIDGDAVTYGLISGMGSAEGSVVFNTDGSYSFDPGSDFQDLADGETRDVSFDYEADDGNGGTGTGTVTVTIIGANDAPIASGVDLGATAEDTARIITSAELLAASSDLDGDTLSVTSVSVDAAFGIVTDNGNGTFTFIPAQDFNGDDVALTFTVSDGTVTDIATALIDVTPVNDAAVVGGDDTGVVTEDVDPDGDGLLETAETLTVSDIDTGEASFVAGTITGTYGSLSIDSSGNWAYAADNSQAAIQSLNDGESLTDVITVSTVDGTTHNVIVMIGGVNDAPIASGVDLGATAEDTARVITSAELMIASSDLDGDMLSVTSVSVDAAFGVVSDNGNDTFTFTPVQDFNGDDVALTFTVSDGTVTDTATALIDVTPVNDAAIIGGTDTGAVTEDVDPDSDGLLEVSGVLTVSDAEVGEASFVAETVVGTYGDLTIDASGAWNYAADNTQVAIQALSDGESLTDTLIITTADGTTSDVIVTIGGANELIGSAGDDTLEGGSGDDTLTGGEGSDVFVFSGNSGDDVITDFDASADLIDIEFTSTDFTSLADVIAASTDTTQNGQAGVLIDLGNSDSVFVNGITVNDLNTSNLNF
jgi:VCBS repeat-containing protein